MMRYYQMGKAGLTESFIAHMKKGFSITDNKAAKVALLKSSTRDKVAADKMGKEICAKLETDKLMYKFKLIGFTLVISKYRNKKKALAKMAKAKDAGVSTLKSDEPSAREGDFATGLQNEDRREEQEDEESKDFYGRNKK